MKKMILVTQHLIDEAVIASSSHCMIADAIKEAMPDVRHVMVDLQTIRFTVKESGERLIYFTPPQCQKQLLRFDQGTQVEPWSFRLPTTPTQVIPRRQKSESEAAPRKTLTVPKPGRRTPPVVHGGKAPATAVLSNHRGSRRVFGIRAAKGFDPSLPVG